MAEGERTGDAQLTDFQKGFNTGAQYETYKREIEGFLEKIRPYGKGGIEHMRYCLRMAKSYHQRMIAFPQDHLTNLAKNFAKEFGDAIDRAETTVQGLEARVPQPTPTS
ncbi:hypothetical protein CMI37_35250 [Candidatus Pacearchaeota archaeon]|nr:hypothetical protein [Candidatus Pacearchaeota archaeon]|tara:strand:+ start:1575 stop:1901 length:327 start_codon:yes stop_codon:yes gene_type:complete